MPLNERLTFVKLILASLDHEEDETHHLWIREVHDRTKAVKKSQAKLLDFERFNNVS